MSGSDTKHFTNSTLTFLAEYDKGHLVKYKRQVTKTVIKFCWLSNTDNCICIVLSRDESTSLKYNKILFFSPLPDILWGFLQLGTFLLTLKTFDYHEKYCSTAGC